MQDAEQTAYPLAGGAGTLEGRFPNKGGESGGGQTASDASRHSGNGSLLPIPFRPPIVPATFRFRHFAGMAECHGTITSANAARLTKCWFAIDDIDEVTVRMSSSCRKVIDLILPLAKAPAGLSPNRIETRAIDDLTSSFQDGALRQRVEGWLQCPASELSSFAELKKHRASRKKRFDAMASRMGTYGGDLCDLIEFHVSQELKRFALAWCYFGAGIQAHGEAEIAKYQADFDTLLRWATDYRTWDLDKQKLASSQDDPLASLRYLKTVPDLIKLWIFRVPGIESPHREDAVFAFAEEEIGRFRADANRLGMSGAMASSEYRNTGFDIDRLRADHAELRKWAQEWRCWDRGMVMEARARKVGVLHRFQYMAEVDWDVLMMYCRAPGGACSLISIEHELAQARTQLERFLQEGAL